jgi:hypothetical protein
MKDRTAECCADLTVSTATSGTLQGRSLGPTGNLLDQFARYVVVGGLAFVVDFGLLCLLTELVRLHYLISAAVAFPCSVVTTYCLSRLWVFDRRTLENPGLELLSSPQLASSVSDGTKPSFGSCARRSTFITWLGKRSAPASY